MESLCAQERSKAGQVTTPETAPPKPIRSFGFGAVVLAVPLALLAVIWLIFALNLSLWFALPLFGGIGAGLSMLFAVLLYWGNPGS